MNIKNLIKTEFIRNVATLLSGSALSQIIVFFITPILTRLYSEELFGVYFVFVSTLNILKKISTLRLELAIILPKKDFWAINAFALSIITTIFSSFIFLLLAIFLKKILINFEKISSIADYFLFLPITLFFIGIYETFAAWNNRKKIYKKISAGKVIYYSSTSAIQIGVKYTIFENSGLILGMVIGQIISSIIIAAITLKSVFENSKDISIKRMKILLYRYRNIPTFNTLINFITNISNEIPVYLFTGFYSTTISGLYGMANKVVATPMNMLSQSIGQVFYQKASEKFSNNENIQPLIKKTGINVLKIGIIPIIGIGALSPFIHYILGKEWISLIPYILLILPNILVNFVVQPLTVVPTIVNKQNILLYLLIFSSILKIAAIWIGLIIFENPLMSLFLLTLTSTVFRIYLCIWIYKSAAVITKTIK